MEFGFGLSRGPEFLDSLAVLNVLAATVSFLMILIVTIDELIPLRGIVFIKQSLRRVVIQTDIPVLLQLQKHGNEESTDMLVFLHD